MPIQEIPNPSLPPRLQCPNCSRELPLDIPDFTFCSDRCVEEFDDILTPIEWDELGEKEKTE